ncbi:profilin-4 isoform X1 [Nycticebus coucang]|uniref:profilin-4 isoform X1 n=1 Tax=Nycticebus coucang TaxID=9470 RepID=UPI00234E1F33|nr:profilin-4 isoform X1 [Nycticebus coucang]XP_053445150.1 profilin-4 isoform X1 [Nycticebus coucang]
MSHLQNLLLDALLGTKHVDSAALINIQDQTVCVASPGFNVMPTDVRTLVNGYAKNPLQARREGLYFKEKDYKCVRADESSLYAKNENTGVIVVKTHLYLIVATYNESMFPSVCVEATEKLDQFIIAKSWKKPKCPSIHKWINKLWYMYTMEYYAALKKNGHFTSFMFTWMELEHILLSKVSQEWKKKYPMYSALL